MSVRKVLDDENGWSNHKCPHCQTKWDGQTTIEAEDRPALETVAPHGNREGLSQGALIRVNRLPLPSRTSNPIALLAGVLDAGGNVFYLLAKQYIRLDVAAVLSSMYPATTILLASIIFKERVSRNQGIGVLVCLAAIALIMI